MTDLEHEINRLKDVIRDIEATIERGASFDTGDMVQLIHSGDRLKELADYLGNYTVS